MTLSPKGLILWIFLLQYRHFSLREVNMLCKFTTMHEDPRSKKASIFHSEMSSEFLTNYGTNSPPPDQIKNLPHKTAIDVDVTIKRQRVANPNIWNPKLMAALKKPLQTTVSPTFTKIMKFCKNDAYSIFPKGYPVCVPNKCSEIFSSTRSTLKIIPRPQMHRLSLSWPCWRTSQKNP